MANPSAAQEPSMEEILASIRQIISEDDESSDAGHKPAEAASEPASSEPAATEPVADDVESDDEPEEGGLADLAAAALKKDDKAEPAQERDSGSIFESMQPASSFDDDKDEFVDTGRYESPFDALQAKKSEMDQAAEQAASDPEPEPEEPAVVAEPEPDPVEDPEPIAAEAAPEEMPAAPEPEIAEAVSYEPEPEPEVVAVAEPAVQVAAEPAPFANAEPESPNMSAPKPVEFQSGDHSDAEDDGLISPDKGASVSNAFSSLTHTILSQNARTLDDLVSDMLQPMLKDWLDENLPTLVERLVKQEIDRMARGGRR